VGHAAETERFRRSAEEIQKQLRDTIADANAAKAAAWPYTTDAFGALAGLEPQVPVPSFKR
jgi:hypothetical protein